MDKKAKKDDRRPLNSLQLLYDEDMSKGSLKLSLYEVLFQLFHSNKVGAKNLKYKKILFILSNIFQSLQMIGILVTAQDIDNWESYKLVWNVFQFIRLDHLAVELGVLVEVSFAIEVASIVHLVFFLLLVTAVYYKQMPPNFIFLAFKLTIVLAVFVLRVPFQILIQSLALYQVSELYSVGWPGNIPLAILAMASYVFFYVICLAGYSDIRHIKENIAGRSCSHLEVSTFIVRFAAITYFVYKGSSQMVYLCVVVIIGECYLIKQCVLSQYYYNHFANQVKALSYTIVVSSAIAVMIGNLANSAGACILIFSMVTPTLSAAVLMGMPNNRDRKPSVKLLKHLIKNPQAFPTFLDVEKVLRPFFIMNLTEHRDLVLKAVSVYFRASCRNKSSHLVVWETNYCLEALKNERLARIKLTKRLISDYSLEGDFQAFVLFNHIMHNGTEYFKEIDFLQFRAKLDDTRETDANLCKNFLVLMEELTETNPKTSLVHELIQNISLYIERVDYVYDILCTAYRTNKEVFDLYRTFLIDILRDEEKARLLVEKYGEINEEDPKVLEYFDSSNAVMIVSGNYNDLGLITYVNECLIELLQEPDLLGKTINDVIPPPFLYNHSKMLEHYLYNCKDMKIGVPKSVYMLNSLGFIVEFYIKIKCIAMNSFPVFLLILKPKIKDRELAIFDEFGTIQCHTKNLGKVLKLRRTVLNGVNIEELMLNYGLCEWQSGCAYYIFEGYRVYQSEKKIRSMTIRIYKFYKDYPEFRRKITKNSDPLQGLTLNERIIRNTHIKRIHMTENAAFNSQRENEEIHGNVKSQESENDRKKIMSLMDLPTRATKLISVCLGFLVVIIAFLTVSHSIYLLNGLDSSSLFESLKAIIELKFNFAKIANEARMVDLIDYQHSLVENVIPFQNFVKHNHHMIDFLTSCKCEYVLYDKNIGYWDETQLKYANLIDFSNMLTANSFEYFEKEDTVKAYKFIIANSRSFPYNYMKEVLNSVSGCIDKTKDKYIFILDIMVSISCIFIAIILAVSIFLTVKLRHWAIKYWEMFQRYISENYLNVQSIFVNRLELVHGYREVIDMFRPFKKANWKRPHIPLCKYIWRNVVLCILIFSYYSFFSYYFMKDLSSTIDHRVELAIKLGESTVQTQELNFWTREMMFEGSLEALLADLYPLRDVKDQFLRTHEDLQRLLKLFMRKEKVEFTESEIEMFYDRTKYENTDFMAGIYGNIQMLLLDSKFYAFAEGNTESMYKKFLNHLLKTDEYQEYLFKQSLDNSIGLIDTTKKLIVITNFAFFLIVLIASYCIFVPFIREEKDMVKHKYNIMQIIRFKDNYTRL